LQASAWQFVAPPEVLFVQYLIAVWQEGDDGSQQEVPVCAETRNAAATTNKKRILYYHVGYKV
jgi:hypothetical protein